MATFTVPHETLSQIAANPTRQQELLDSFGVTAVKDAMTAQVATATAAASAAAASATAAANAVASQFKGGISGASVPATSPLAGDYYRVTSAGTSQGKTWAVGDLAVYSGTSGAWTQVPGNIVQQTDIFRLENTRQMMDYVQSDGVTGARRISGAWGARGNIAGSDMTFACLIQMPAAFTQGTKIVDVSNLDGSSTITNNNHTFSISINSAGHLTIRQNGTAPENFRSQVFNFFQTSRIGRWLRMVVVLRGNSTVTPKVWVDGVDVSASFTANNGGIIPNWMPPELLCTYVNYGNVWPEGPVPMVAPINRAWSQADVDWWQATGWLPAIDMYGGSMQSLPANLSSFEDGGTTGFANSSGTTRSNYDHSTNPDGVGAAHSGTRSMKVAMNATEGANRGITFSTDVVPSTLQVCDMEAMVYVMPGCPDIFLEPTNTTAWPASGVSVGNAGVTGAWVKITRTGMIRGSGTNGSVRIGTKLGVLSGAGTFYVDSVKVTIRGALTLPTIQGNRTLRDGTGNGNAMILTPGMTPQTSDKGWTSPGRTHASASGNQQLLGGPIVADPSRHRIDSVVIRNNGSSTATVSIGWSSGGAQYVSALIVPAGTTVDGPLLTRILGGDSIWVSSNVIGELSITVEGHRIAI